MLLLGGIVIVYCCLLMLLIHCCITIVYFNSDVRWWRCWSTVTLFGTVPLHCIVTIVVCCWCSIDTIVIYLPRCCYWCYLFLFVMNLVHDTFVTCCCCCWLFGAVVIAIVTLFGVGVVAFTVPININVLIFYY